MNDYYVYIYWRLDINEPFYIGMGKGKRWRKLQNRNPHFERVINKNNIAVEIVKDNLTEEQAHGIECWLINELVFEYGFSIDIKGSNSTDHFCHLVNMTWGGEGISGYHFSDESKKRRSDSMIGEGNNMFGKNIKDFMTENAYAEWKRKQSESHKGEKAYWYGKHLPEETKRKISQNHARLSGKHHPNYGKSLSDEQKRKISKTRLENGLAKGKNNPNAKVIICLTTGKIFYTIKDGAEYYGLKCVSGISAHLNGKKNFAGKTSRGIPLKWMYLKDFLEKCEYILL